MSLANANLRGKTLEVVQIKAPQRGEGSLLQPSAM